MHPLMMAALISGGVNALQGKRGSDLLKSTVRDTAIAAALGGMKTPTPGAESGISSFSSAQDAARVAGTSGVPGGGDPSMFFKQPKPSIGTRLERGFSAIEKPFSKEKILNYVKRALESSQLKKEKNKICHK
mgnify:CR=1 FL=1